MGKLKKLLTREEALERVAHLLGKCEEAKESVMFDKLARLCRDFKKIEVLDDMVHTEGWEFMGITGIGMPLLNLAHQGFDNADDYLWKLYDLINEIRWCLESFMQEERQAA